MSFWTDLIDRWKNNWSVSFTKSFSWTGYTKPMVELKKLDEIQDQVFADKRYWPKDDDPDHKTFCNMATIAIAQGVGCHALDSPPGKEPLMADEIYRLLLSTPAVFHPVTMRDCQQFVNDGHFVLAILPSFKLRQAHGHLCTLTSGVGDHSGRWDAHTPMCMNLGRAGTCFRRKGVNWAFQTIPEFFAWAK
jgi:hypothetical protein